MKVFCVLFGHSDGDGYNTFELRGVYSTKELAVKSLSSLHIYLPFKCSDSVLLAHIKDSDLAKVSVSPKQKRIIQPFRRNDGYRFCLKPYFEEHEPN